MANKIGRLAYKVILSDSERSFLEGVIRKSTSPQSHVTRAKIALGAADGLTQKEIISFSGASGFTVARYARQRFVLVSYITVVPSKY